MDQRGATGASKRQAFGTTEIIYDPIIRFYKGEDPDSSGRYIEEVWKLQLYGTRIGPQLHTMVFSPPEKEDLRLLFGPQFCLCTEQLSKSGRYSRSGIGVKIIGHADVGVP